MAMNMVRTLTSGGVGVASGAMGKMTANQPPLFTLGQTGVGWDAIIETAALAGGFALQFMAPMMAPNMADGLVDGGIALLGARVTRAVVPTPAPAAYAVPGVATQVNPYALAGGHAAQSFARSQVGGVAGVPKRKLT